MLELTASEDSRERGLEIVGIDGEQTNSRARLNSRAPSLHGAIRFETGRLLMPRPSEDARASNLARIEARTGGNLSAANTRPSISYHREKRGERSLAREDRRYTRRFDGFSKNFRPGPYRSMSIRSRSGSVVCPGIKWSRGSLERKSKRDVPVSHNRGATCASANKHTRAVAPLSSGAAVRAYTRARGQADRRANLCFFFRPRWKRKNAYMCKRK